MGKHINKRNEQPAARRKALRDRCIRLAEDTQRIRDDLGTDCLPYWKIKELKENLLELADDLREFI